MKTPRIMYYEDGRHSHIYTYEPPMQKEEYEAVVNQLLGTPVDTLVFCLGEGRTMLHDTKAGEFWGHNVDKWPHTIWRRAHQNAKNLIEEGNDPLRIICERAQSEGFMIYPSLNIQWDSAVRGEGSIWVRVSDFRFDNTDLEIGADGNIDPDFPGIGCMDFKHEKVRDERFGIIQESVTEYPVDGFEINLAQMPYFFHPKETDAGRTIMTEWISKIHSTVKNSGADRKLAIRVINNIDRCFELGLDVKEWIKQGIVDVIIVEDRHHRVNPMADFTPFVQAVEGTSCTMIAVIQNLFQDGSSPHKVDNIEKTRATACNYWNQNIGGLFLDRGWFVDAPYGDSFYAKLRELPYPHLMDEKDKTYYVSYPGRMGDEDTNLQPCPELPIELSVGIPTHTEFTISDDLQKWNAVKRIHDVLLRINIVGITELDKLEFKLNGQKLPESCLRTINLMFRMSIPENRSIGGYLFIFRPDMQNWPVKGKNDLEITLLKRDPDVITDVAINKVEIETKYLLGRNFYHGRSDSDLGE